MGRKPSPEEMVFRMAIGHYGGMYVEIPEERFKQFRALFPKRSFPRRVRTRDVKEMLTPEGEARLYQRFPKSTGIIKEVYFANLSKGLEILDRLNLPYHKLSRT
jgi:hypothetical protein